MSNLICNPFEANEKEGFFSPVHEQVMIRWKIE